MDDNFVREPKCIQVGVLEGDKWDKMHDIARRFYDTGGIAPTIHTVGGGNLEPKIAEPICLNSKVNGKQPSLQDRIYSVDGTSTARTKEIVIHEIAHAVHWQMTDKMEIKDAESLCFFVERYAEEIIRLANEVMAG